MSFDDACIRPMCQRIAGLDGLCAFHVRAHKREETEAVRARRIDLAQRAIVRAAVTAPPPSATIHAHWAGTVVLWCRATCQQYPQCHAQGYGLSMAAGPTGSSMASSQP